MHTAHGEAACARAVGTLLALFSYDAELFKYALPLLAAGQIESSFGKVMMGLDHP